MKAKHLNIYAWVIMSNHIHLAAKCDPPGGMSAFLRDFKKFTSKKFIEVMESIPEAGANGCWINSHLKRKEQEGRKIIKFGKLIIMP